MRQVIRMARTFAETRQPVLLQGEVGSGKALFAQSIHNASAFAQGPFVIFAVLLGGMIRLRHCLLRPGMQIAVHSI